MQNTAGDWFILDQRQPAMLSAVQPPDVRHPGPVISTGSKVRECGRTGAGSRFDEICLEVALPSGAIERGYTYSNLVALPKPSPRRTWLLSSIGLVGVVAALLAIFQW